MLGNMNIINKCNNNNNNNNNGTEWMGYWVNNEMDFKKAPFGPSIHLI
jgi:hypothetical protein